MQYYIIIYYRGTSVCMYHIREMSKHIQDVVNHHFEFTKPAASHSRPSAASQLLADYQAPDRTVTRLPKIEMQVEIPAPTSDSPPKAYDSGFKGAFPLCYHFLLGSLRLTGLALILSVSPSLAEVLGPPINSTRL